MDTGGSDVQRRKGPMCSVQCVVCSVADVQLQSDRWCRKECTLYNGVRSTHIVQYSCSVRALGSDEVEGTLFGVRC